MPNAFAGLIDRVTLFFDDSPPEVLRCVEFAPGESEGGLDVFAPIVVEGVLVVRHHPAWGEFAAVEEVLVREARRVR